MKAIHIILASALVTAAAIKAVPALAEPPAVQVETRIVHTADLDLSSNRGQRQLDVRLARAARDVCGSASDADLAGKNAIRACRATVLARAQDNRNALLASAQAGEPVVLTAAR